uniref:Tetrahydroalstonine synthase 1 n=1 Tax=Rauvolfia tetraphylla TaxID=545371 RepID=A0A6M2RFB9_RAUTE|nr:tetrahydroalstonine synthase 1 [Rauvolfia tetraphylla]
MAAAETAKKIEAYGWAARDTSGVLSPFKFQRRATAEHDVQLKVLYCGMCDWDSVVVKNGFGTTKYPIVPGHEVVGVVTEIGSKVQNFKVGDVVGVSSYVRTCRKCKRCKEGFDSYCPNLITADGTSFSDGNDIYFHDPNDTESKIYGGFSNITVVDEYYVVRWPENFPLAAGVPLLCAGTVPYSPMRCFGFDKPEIHLGVVGLGGIGKLTVKFAKAFGAKVTVISTSIDKKQEAIEKYGADRFLLSKEPEQLQAAADTLDGIIDTVPRTHPILPLIKLLKFDGTLVLLGAPLEPYELPVSPLLMGRKRVVGSAGASMKETQEMMDFAAKHNIVADVEIIPMDYASTAIERIEKGDFKNRFVVDIGNTLKSA